MISDFLQSIWPGVWVVVPLAVLVAFVCRVIKTPATRHALWLVVLVSFVTPPLVVALDLVPSIQVTIPTLDLASAERGRERDPDRASASEEARGVTADATPAATESHRKATHTHAGSPREVGSRTTPRSPGMNAAVASGQGAMSMQSGSARHHQGIRFARRGTVETPVMPAATISQVPDAATGPGKLESMLIGARAELAAWVNELSRSTEMIIRTSPMPTWLWMSGTLVVALLWGGRLVFDWRVRTRARPAPPVVRTLVAEASSWLGLSNVPEVKMTSATVSPMVSISRGPCIVIPEQLWWELDGDSRRAVLLHELAHLRRRDHWVCWVQLLIGALFWWHPVAWWTRRSLHTEADLSCDAWVMALMPAHRREYAETLLRTKQYVSRPGVPSLGLAMASGRAKQFSRRLTMVMTKRVRPGLTPVGGVAAAVVALLGIVVMPGLACPPKKAEKKSRSEVAVEVLVAPTPPRAPKADAAPEGTTFDQFMRGQGNGESKDTPRADELKRYLERLSELERRLDDLQMFVGDSGATDPIAAQSFTITAPSVPAANPFVAALPDSDETVARAYYMPRGRLDALTQLMIRQDVPTLVSPEGDHLIVYATPSDHKVFEAFARLVCPGHLKVIDVETGQEVSRATRGLTAPAVIAATTNLGLVTTSDDLCRERKRQELTLKRSQARQLRHTARTLAQQHRSYERQIRLIERQAEECEAEAGCLRDKASSVAEQVECYLSKAEDQEACAYDSLMSKAKNCQAEANSLEAKADAMEAQAFQLSDQASRLEAIIVQLEQQCERVEHEAEACEDEVRDLESDLN